METLLNYLDNLFASLPNTEAVRRAKSNLQDSMEERYNELKAAGKSENEAIGTVISEFGNIDELKQLFSPEPESQPEPQSRFEAQKEGLDSQSAPETPPEDGPVVDIAMADEYLEVSRKTDMMVGMGVFLCIVSPALLILMATLMPTDLGGILGLIPLFIGVAIGVALFIFADHLKEPYKYLNSAFIPDPEMITWVVEKKAEESGGFTLGLTSGICLCVLSPLAVILPSVTENDLLMELGVVLLLLLVAAGVFLIIVFGSQRGHYGKLVQDADYYNCAADPTPKAQETAREKSFKGMYWPIVTVLYLGSSFLSGNWGSSWIIWPLAAILYKVIRNMFLK